MKRLSHSFVYLGIIAGISTILAAQQAARAHCDGLDGPVVNAARQALEAENVNYVLIWVLPQYEDRIREAFESTLHVRQEGPEAKALADRYFFETLVRLHREGEGAPYTGLKRAGRDLGPAIPAADRALETGSIEELEALLVETLQKGLIQHFEAAKTQQDFSPENVTAGRTFVERYVRFIHYVEMAYEALARNPSGHFPEQEAKPSTAEE